MAGKLLDNNGAAQFFCRNCEMDSSCDHSGCKITAKALYVLRYVYDFEAGIHSYPFAGSWENQPQWFTEMFNAGRARLIKLRNEAAEKQSRSK